MESEIELEKVMAKLCTKREKEPSRSDSPNIDRRRYTWRNFKSYEVEKGYFYCRFFFQIKRELEGEKKDEEKKRMKIEKEWIFKQYERRCGKEKAEGLVK